MRYIEKDVIFAILWRFCDYYGINLSKSPRWENDQERSAFEEYVKRELKKAREEMHKPYLD